MHASVLATVVAQYMSECRHASVDLLMWDFFFLSSAAAFSEERCPRVQWKAAEIDPESKRHVYLDEKHGDGAAAHTFFLNHKACR